MDAEWLMVLVTAAVAVVPWAFSIHAKVAVIAQSVEALPEVVAELRGVLQEHEHRLDEHAEAIEALKKTASPGR